MFERLREGVKLRLHRASRIGRQFMAQAFGGSVRAMRGGKCVVHPDVAKFGKRSDESGIVLFFAGVETRVLEAENVTGLHGGNGTFCWLADAIGGEFNRPLDDAWGLGGPRLERLFQIAPLRPAEMREQDHLATFVGNLGDRWRRTLDPC